jgi:hypothetical protein
LDGFCVPPRHIGSRVIPPSKYHLALNWLTDEPYYWVSYPMCTCVHWASKHLVHHQRHLCGSAHCAQSCTTVGEAHATTGSQSNATLSCLLLHLDDSDRVSSSRDLLEHACHLASALASPCTRRHQPGLGGPHWECLHCRFWRYG